MIGITLLLILAVLAGKFFADNTTGRRVISAPKRKTAVADSRPSLGSRPSSESRASSVAAPATKVIVTYKTIDLSDKKTPAERRATITNKKCNLFTPASITDAFQKATLKYSRGKAVSYVYNSGDLISRNIMQSGSWEGGYIAAMETIFNFDTTLNLIDIGCNLGVYTIVAAMRKRHVVAVDANINNIKRLRKALLENKVDKRVQLIYNGISNKYSEFSVSSPEAGNIGHSLLAAAKKGDAHLVKSILMDDLLEVIDFKRAIMKIDIEGHEYEAFQHADKLFTEVDIPAVMMEWNWLGKNSNPKVPKSIIDFFTRFNYKAYNSIVSDSPLNLQSYKSWPWDIVWKKHYDKMVN